MFNDRYGLEQAVIAGTKTMTRRRIHFPGIDDKDVSRPVMGIDDKGRVYFTFDAITEDVDIYPQYQIGERVAVAQSYENIPMEHFMNGIDDPFKRNLQEQLVKQAAAYKNKLFAVASLMPHIIKITNIKAERLQTISNDDCLKEGVRVCKDGGYWLERPSRQFGGVIFDTPSEAYAALIDKVSGPNTWNLNQWVFAYEFELIK